MITHGFIAEVARRIILRLERDDYAFTVTSSDGNVWDVYHFVQGGRAGTIAMRMENGQAIVGALAAGTLAESHILEQIEMYACCQAN